MIERIIASLIAGNFIERLASDDKFIEQLKLFRHDRRHQLLYAIFRHTSNPSTLLFALESIFGADYFAPCLGHDNNKISLKQQALHLLAKVHEEKDNYYLAQVHLSNKYYGQPHSGMPSYPVPSAIDLAIADGTHVSLIKALRAFGVSVDRVFTSSLLPDQEKTTLQAAMDTSNDYVVDFILSQKPSLGICIDGIKDAYIGSGAHLIPALEYAVLLNRPDYFKAIYKSNPEAAQVVLKQNRSTPDLDDGLLALAVRLGFPEMVKEIIAVTPNLFPTQPTAYFFTRGLKSEVKAVDDNTAEISEVKQAIQNQPINQDFEEVKPSVYFFERLLKSEAQAADNNTVIPQNQKTVIALVKQLFRDNLIRTCVEALKAELVSDCVDWYGALEIKLSDDCKCIQQWIGETLLHESFSSEVDKAAGKSKSNVAEQAPCIKKKDALVFSSIDRKPIGSITVGTPAATTHSDTLGPRRRLPHKDMVQFNLEAMRRHLGNTEEKQTKIETEEEIRRRYFRRFDHE